MRLLFILFTVVIGKNNNFRTYDNICIDSSVFAQFTLKVVVDGYNMKSQLMTEGMVDRGYALDENQETHNDGTLIAMMNGRRVTPNNPTSDNCGPNCYIFSGINVYKDICDSNGNLNQLPSIKLS